MEPRLGFEPKTPSLPWKCSTTELSRRTSVNCNKKDLLCQEEGAGGIHEKFIRYDLKKHRSSDRITRYLRAALAQLVRAAVL